MAIVELGVRNCRFGKVGVFLGNDRSLKHAPEHCRGYKPMSGLEPLRPRYSPDLRPIPDGNGAITSCECFSNCQEKFSE